MVRRAWLQHTHTENQRCFSWSRSVFHHLKCTCVKVCLWFSTSKDASGSQLVASLTNCIQNKFKLYPLQAFTVHFLLYTVLTLKASVCFKQTQLLSISSTVVNQKGITAHFSQVFKLSMVLHPVVRMNSDRRCCVKNEKKRAREQYCPIVCYEKLPFFPTLPL